jgi:hypothetical protein
MTTADMRAVAGDGPAGADVGATDSDVAQSPTAGLVRRVTLRSRTLDELTAWAESRGIERYRANQIAGWPYNRPVTLVGRGDA